MKRALVTLTLIVAAAVALVLVGPSLIDWSGQRDRVAAELTRLVGQPVAIGGALDVAMLPRPHFVARDVQIGDPASRGGETRITVAAVEGTLSFGRLLAGQVEADRVVLHHPVFAGAALPEDVAGAVLRAGRILPDWVTLRSVRVVGGTVTGAPGADAGPEGAGRVLVRALEGEVTVSRNGVTAVTGSAIYEGTGTPFRIEATLQPPTEAGDIDYTLRGDIGGLAALTLGGRLAGAAPPREPDDAGAAGGASVVVAIPDMPEGAPRPDLDLSGALTVSVPDLAAALRAFGLPAHDGLGRSLSLRADLSTAAGGVELAQLSADLGATRIEGSVAVATGGAQGVDAQLTFGPIALDPAGGRGGATALLDAIAAVLGHWPVPGSSRLDLTLPSIDAGDGTVRDLRLTGSFDGRSLDLGRLTARLPGGTNLAASGAIAMAPEGARFAVRLDGDSDDLRTFLAWAGVPLGDIATGRLRRAEAAFDLEGRPDGFTVSGLSLTLDGVPFAGGFAYVAAGPDRRRPGLGLRLETDRLDLDALRLPGAPPWSTRWREDAAFRTGILGLLTAIDANLELELGALVLDGRDWQDLSLDATLAEGGLLLRRGTVSVGGLRLGLAGAVADLAGLGGIDMLVEAASEDLAEPLRSFAGLRLPRLSALEEVTLAGRLRGAPAALEVELAAALLDGTLSVAGAVDLVTPALPSALTIRLVQPDLPRLVRALDPLADLPDGLGPVALSGVARPEGSGWRLDTLRGELGGTRLEGEALVQFDGARPFIDATIDATDIVLDALLPQSWSVAAAPALGPWPSLRIDPSILGRVDGRFRLALEGLDWGEWRFEAPVLAARLTEGRLAVDRFEAGLDGGRLLIEGELATTPRPAAQFAFELTDGEAALLLPRLIGRGGMEGRTDIAFAGAATGQSVAELVGTLTGTGRLTLRAADVHGFDLDQTALLLEAPGQPLAFLQALRDAFADGVTRFDTLEADLAAGDGRVAVRNLRLLRPGSVAEGEGMIDLLRWQMRTALEFGFAAHPEQPKIGLVVEGAPDAPLHRLDTQPLLNWVARRAAEAGGLSPGG